MNKKILAQIDNYKLECNRVYHYFSGKELKEEKLEKCWCKNE